MLSRVIRVSMQGVRSRLGRSVLTGVSLFIGVLAIVVIQAGSGAAREAVVAASVLSNGSAVTLRVPVDPGLQAYRRAEQLLADLERMLGRIGGSSALLADSNAKIDDRPIEFTLVRGDLRAILPFPLRSGTWLGPNEVAPREIVLNEAAASSLSLSKGAATRVSMSEEVASARVVGVVFDGSPQAHAYARLDSNSDWGRTSSAHQEARLLVHVQGADLQRFKRLVSTEYVRVFDTGPAVTIERSDQDREYDRQLGTIALVFSVVAGLSLLVGSLGILNIGLATLKERSDELSLRRSFGATRLEVVMIIAMEGQIVALAAAFLALCVGLAAFPYVAEQLSGGMLQSAQSFPIDSAAVGVAASCTAALLGSLAPAIRASRVPIASIMRV